MLRPHHWKQCKPAITDSKSGEINEELTYVAQAYFDSLSDQDKLTFHEARCLNNERIKHLVAINRFKEYLRKQNI